MMKSQNICIVSIGFSFFDDAVMLFVCVCPTEAWLSDGVVNIVRAACMRS